MKRRWQIVLAAGATLGCAWIAAGPFSHEIEFRVFGHAGKEKIWLTRNWGLQTVVPERAIGPHWSTIRAMCYGPMHNLQVHLSGLNNSPNLVSIESGVVRVTSRNLLGFAIDRQDWLNINSRYLARRTHEPLFAEDSPIMASARAGDCGANGYYQLVPP